MVSIVNVEYSDNFIIYSSHLIYRIRSLSVCLQRSFEVILTVIWLDSLLHLDRLIELKGTYGYHPLI